MSLTNIVISCFLAWLVAQLLKTLLDYLKTKKVHIQKLYQTGGMPSSHSSLVSALAFSIYLTEGFTALFIVSVVMAVIVMRDAISLRHKPLEVGMGILIGLIITMLVFWI